MILGVPRDARLIRACQAFLIDCKAAGRPDKTLRECGEVLRSFITFTGNMLVRELGPDHVRFYMSELSGRSKRVNTRLLMKHYSIVRAWIRWMYSQKRITERHPEGAKPPHWSLSSMLTDEEVVLYKANGRTTRVHLCVADEDPLEALRAELSHQRGHRRPQ